MEEACKIVSNDSCSWRHCQFHVLQKLLGQMLLCQRKDGGGIANMALST